VNGALQFTVNQLHEGDHLPIPVPPSSQYEQKVQLGCDRAFSPVAAPGVHLAYATMLLN
jgi:hypothetical protein